MRRTAVDLTVGLGPDRPGALAAATAAIAQAGVDIGGHAQMEDILHLLPDKPSEARQGLETAGFQVLAQREVLLVDLADEPGVAARLFQQIAEAGINVKFTYLATNNRMVIAVDDAQILSRLVEMH